ncbi:MAG: glycosyltransferase family 4 protein [Pseudomonadota bacterium]
MLSEKMKIAYLIPGCGVSGGIAVICQHANRLLKRGHKVLLVTESVERFIDWFPDQKVPIVGLNQYPKDIDILVATGWSTSFRVAVLPAQKKFYFVQSDETRFHPRNSSWEHITRLSYTIGYNYLTEARWIKAWLADSFGHNAELVPNGLDENIFFPAEPLQPKGTKPRILLEGAIGLPYKGMAEAFTAVRDLDVEVWCVSSYGKPEKRWKCDRFFEHVPMTEMRRIYSSCDILLKLSRVEGFFGPPMEMMACGGTVIVGEVTGYDEYIENEVNALVVNPMLPQQAAKAICRLIDDRDLKARLTENGRLTAQNWQWESSIDILEAYYIDVLDGKRGTKMTTGKAASAISLAYFYGQLRGEDILSVLTKLESVKPTSVSTDGVLNVSQSHIDYAVETRTSTVFDFMDVLRRSLLSIPNRFKHAVILVSPYIGKAIRNPLLGVRMIKMAISILRISGFNGLKLAVISRGVQRQLLDDMRHQKNTTDTDDPQR